MNNFFKIYKRPIVIALIQWFVTTVLQIDRLFFSYDTENVYMLGTKVMYLFFLLISWCFGYYALKKIKSKDEYYSRAFYIFKVYLTIILILLLILWPGIWSWDDLWTLDSIAGYESWHPWQHVFTGIYQNVLLQILPFPGGIILLQNVIIGLCVAFSVTKLEKAYNLKHLKYKIIDTTVKLLPFLLPPVLSYQFSGYRIGLYVYLELVMLVILITAIKDRKEWSISYLLLFCSLCIVVASWRTESFFYGPCACLLILAVNKKTIPYIKKGICIFLIVVGFICVNKFQSYQLGNSNYEVISLMRPCVVLVHAADQEADAKELAAIDRVTSIKTIYDNPSYDGEALYWRTDAVRNAYSDDDYSKFLEAIVKLSIKYPKVVFAERWKLFVNGSGMTGKTGTNILEAERLFEENNGNTAATATLGRGWIVNRPVFKNLRAKFIHSMGMTDRVIIQRVVWNSMIPLMVLFFAWFKLLRKKSWYLLGICTAVLIRVPIVVLTQPSGLIMYLLSFYFLGYVYLIFEILIEFSELRKIKEIEIDG